MTGTHVIAVYERVLVVIREMLAAARSADWERLVTLERECSRIVADLSGTEEPQALDAAQRQRKTDIIRQVLAGDAEIRNLTEPWLKQLENMLGSAAREHRLREAYDMSGSFKTHRGNR